MEREQNQEGGREKEREREIGLTCSHGVWMRFGKVRWKSRWDGLAT